MTKNTTSAPLTQETDAADFLTKLESIRPKHAQSCILLAQQLPNSAMIPTGFVGPTDMQPLAHLNTGLFAPMDDGTWSERTVQARSTQGLMLDDIGMKNTVHPPLEPTYVIETKPGSQQWVYVYSDLVPLEMGAGMATAAAEAGYSDPFIAKRSHAWHRLPGSLPPPKRAEREAAAAKLGTVPDYTPARLVAASWRTYTFADVAAGLGLTPLPEEVSKFEGSTKFDKETGDNDPVLIWLQGAGLVGRKRQDAAGFMDVYCPNHAQHTDGRPWGRFVPANDLSASAFHCHHGHCGGIGIKRFRKWVEDSGGPTQAVAVGYARDLKFASLVAAMPIPKASDLPEGAMPINGEVMPPEQDVDAQMRTYIRAEITQIADLPPLETDQALANLATVTGYSLRVIKAEMSDLKREIGQQHQTQVVEEGYVSVNGTVIPNYQSTLAFLQQSTMRPAFAFDEFANKPMLLQALPGDAVLTKERPLEDTDYLTVLGEVCQQTAFARVAKGNVIDAVDKCCRNSTYHPVRNYLWSLPETNTNYLDTWLAQFLKADGDAAYLAAIGRKWLIGAVARVMSPGCQMDNALILEGDQGLKKSTVFRVLAGDDHFGDSLPDFHDKAASEYLQGKWIVEMAELTGLRRSELESMRAFLTRRTESFRPAYGRLVNNFKRQCVFAGSTNRDDYLTDANGERRFWIAKCSTMIDIEGLTAARNALWREAYDAFMKGEAWHLDAATEQPAADMQKERVPEDAWFDIISAFTEPMADVCVKQCRGWLKMKGENVERGDVDHRIGRCLTQLGFVKESKRRRFAGMENPVFVWKRV